MNSREPQDVVDKVLARTEVGGVPNLEYCRPVNRSEAAALTRAYSSAKRRVPDEGLAIQLESLKRDPPPPGWGKGAWFVAKFKGDLFLGFVSNYGVVY